MENDLFEIHMKEVSLFVNCYIYKFKDTIMVNLILEIDIHVICSTKPFTLCLAMTTLITRPKTFNTNI